MGTLSDAEIIADFAKGARPIYENWQKNTPIANQNAIVNLLRAAVRNTPITSYSYSFKDFANGSGGQLTSEHWRLEINRAYTNQHALPAYLFQWLCGILYHEARHGEQWFCCAQGIHEGDLVLTTPLSGTGTKSQQIAAAMGNMPANVVTDAENTGSYRLKSGAEKTTIAAWFNSVWGTQAGHRNTVYGMGDLFTPGSAGNLAYTSLPEEVDAYAIQAAVEAAVGAEINTVVQIVVADKAPVATLKTQVVSAPPAVTGPKPVIATGATQGASQLAASFSTAPTLPSVDAVKPAMSRNTVASLASLFSK
ncbi:hypothetical protein [Rhodanobacter sp. C05]|uniref:hypothetical protein n=1 Tax=Rhodanobacter sp. C05 TaxID=1945855 RepID=UPI0009846AE8|nr:hypothetical protein [Rhodanobacter sp. C05]OOG42705.1 hypothetical protein B0E51_04480 [Rhodanobacter sp. C05]